MAFFGAGICTGDDKKAFFLPGSGVLDHLRTPEAYGDTLASAAERSSASGHAVRVDTGVGEGDEISVFYDPVRCLPPAMPPLPTPRRLLSLLLTPRASDRSRVPYR